MANPGSPAQEQNGYLRKSDFWKLVALLLFNVLVVVFAAGVNYNKVQTIERELNQIKEHYAKVEQRYYDLHTRVIILENRN